MTCPDLLTLAERIPNQSGPAVAQRLQLYASTVHQGQAIVELGVWMGYCTAHLALAAPAGVVVHGYDHFHAHADSRKKAARSGIEFAAKEDTLPKVRELLAPFGGIVLHKGGIKTARWPGPAIGLHVDDACKRERQFLEALRIFSPWWVAGETIVVLMDFYYFEKKDIPGLRFQHDFVRRSGCFEEIWRAPAGTSAAAFVYRGGLRV